MLVLEHDVPLMISVICVVSGESTLNIPSTSLCGRWNGNPTREFEVVRKIFKIVWRLDSLSLSLIMFVNSVILVGCMLLVER